MRKSHRTITHHRHMSTDFSRRYNSNQRYSCSLTTNMSELKSSFAKVAGRSHNQRFNVYLLIFFHMKLIKIWDNRVRWLSRRVPGFHTEVSIIIESENSSIESENPNIDSENSSNELKTWISSLKTRVSSLKWLRTRISSLNTRYSSLKTRYLIFQTRYSSFQTRYRVFRLDTRVSRPAWYSS